MEKHIDSLHSKPVTSNVLISATSQKFQKGIMYIIGVDGGGTNARSVLLRVTDAQSRKYDILAEKSLNESTNPNSVGPDEARRTLFQCIHALFEDGAAEGLSLLDVDAIGLGISGVDRPQDRVMITSWLRDDLFASNTKILIRVENDAVAALSSGLLGDFDTKDGEWVKMVLISGTGSIVLGTSDSGSTWQRSGGWGPLLGDCYGGYWIGSELMIALANLHDGLMDSWDEQELQALERIRDNVLHSLQLSKTTDLIGYMYTGKLEFARGARLAPHVTSHYEESRLCRDIVERCVANASRDIVQLYKNLTGQRSKKNEECDMRSRKLCIVLCGSVLTYDEGKGIVTTRLLETLGGLFGEDSLMVRMPEVEPSIGAALFTLNDL